MSSGFNMQISINGNLRSFDCTEMSVTDLIKAMDLTGKRIAIECNGEIVTRSQYEHTQLNNGDKLEIVGAVGGG
jgi:sulfur carrier protein